MFVNEIIFLKKIIKNLGSIENLLVGFSGGLDSTVLLHALVRLREIINPNLNIRALYIHHGINYKADNWLIHCKKICLNWKVEFYSQSIHIDSIKHGIEGGARIARYQAFRKILLQKEVLLTAHHLDDQVETFLLALKRGSGPTGLSSMPVSMPFFHTYLIRPLLSFSRKELELYAKKKLLYWIEDDSNQNEFYDRNFLRLRIIPHFCKRWPNFSHAVFRSASLCAEQEALLNEFLEDCCLRLITNEGALKINDLVSYSKIKRNAILRRWFRLHKILMPSCLQLHIIWQEVICARNDAKPEFVLKKNVIRRFQKKLWILPKFKDISNICLPWHLSRPLILPDNLGTLMITNHGIGFRFPFFDEEVTVRFGIKGNIKIIGRQHSRKSKKLWQELGIAPWLRKRIPLIYYNDVLITAVNVFVTEEGRCIDGVELKLNLIKE
ncbi:tRNA lysidine(34) synthetase TilS [Arsenophonus symbiont of Ornithomya chloropus]|uniref:tRNA lysidine(34) synthetase TilS n=1 Tax=Arsenophonus symbiont of Ornithomya chloropus TaxID=634121 RepID=UPI0032B0F732